MLIRRANLTAITVAATLCLAGFGCANTARTASSGSLPSAATSLSTSTTGGKTVYLTFDADMTPAMKRRLEEHKVHSWYDPALLDYLRKDDVPATIFVTGMFAELYPTLITDLSKDSRFSLQNHSYDHSGFEAPCYGLNELKTDDQRKAEIAETQSVLKKLTGKAPTLFRFPGLCKNAHDDAIVASLGLRINDGNLVSGDAFSHNAGRIARHVIADARNGSVVVMHLGGPNAPATADAVRKIVPALRAEGFTFAALP